MLAYFSFKYAMNAAFSLARFFSREVVFALFLVLNGDILAETLTVGGTGSALEAIRQLGSAYAKVDHDFQLVVLPSLGSGGAIKGLASRSVDLGLVSRPLKDAEKSLGLTSIPCAQSPLVLVSNRRSEQGMTSSQLVDIYTGKRLSWDDGSPIRLILRPPTETDSQLLGTLTPNLKAAIESARSRPGLVTAITDQESGDALEKLPGSLGTSTLGLILAERRPLQILALNGVPPSLNGKVNPAYPLRKPLHLVVRQDAKPLTRRFVAFIQSPEGRAFLENIGYSHDFR